MTTKEYAEARLATIRLGLGEPLNNAIRVADGAIAAGELSATVILVVVDGAAALEAVEGLTSRNVVQSLGNQITQWLGKDSRMIVNEAGDKIFLSKDGLRRVQFHINKTYPHSDPHVHIDIKINGKWIKDRYYPKP